MSMTVMGGDDHQSRLQLGFGGGCKYDGIGIDATGYAVDGRCFDIFPDPNPHATSKRLFFFFSWFVKTRKATERDRIRNCGQQRELSTILGLPLNRR